MDYSNFMYNVNSNNIMKNKLDTSALFKEKLNSILRDDGWKNDHTTAEYKAIDDVISNCKTPKEFSQLINLIPDPSNSYDEYWIASKILNIIALRMSNCYSGKDDIYSYNILKDKFSKYEKYHLDNHLVSTTYLDNIGTIIKSLDRINNGITTDYTFYLSPSEFDLMLKKTLSESVSFMDDDGCNPNNTKTLNDHIMDLINETDTDYFIAKMDEIHKYLENLNDHYTDDNCKVFTVAISKALDMVINNITGKEKLLEELEKCDNLLTNYNGSEYELNVQGMLEFIDDTVKAIGENLKGETSLLYEMGLGYMYDIIPKTDAEIESNIDLIISQLNESVSSTDYVSVLNESIKDKFAKRKEDKERKERINDKKKQEEEEFFDNTKNTREDIYRQKLNDDYDREDSGKNTDQEIDNTKKQDKYDFKKQKKQDKYNFKQQKKLDKWEQKKEQMAKKADLKEEKRIARNEARQKRRDETKIGLARWKTLELTNSNVRKCTDALRKCAKAVAVGGVASLVGINPILAGSTYLIRKFFKDPGHHAEAQKLVTDLRTQIIDIDERIQQAESNNEYDKKRALMKMRQKLDTTLKKVSLTERMEGTV